MDGEDDFGEDYNIKTITGRKLRPFENVLNTKTIFQYGFLLSFPYWIIGLGG
ncbi:MAG: hypothetical protein IK004_09860 [Bacteroidales bacterium]|nr:hypothetical protein [Bacteroidales bacterium]